MSALQISTICRSARVSAATGRVTSIPLPGK
jgi:hypothetical protein